jgi:hypothetical protein
MTGLRQRAINAPISCVFRKRTPRSESRAFKIFSAACWQWNPMISSLTRSGQHGIEQSFILGGLAEQQ